MDPISKAAVESKLAAMARAAEERDAQRRAQKQNMPYLNLVTAPINLEAVALIPEPESLKAKLVSLNLKAQKLALAAYDPSEPEAIKLINNFKAKGYQLSIYVVSLSSLKHVWAFYKFIAGERVQIVGKVAIEEQGLNDLKSQLTTLDGVKQVLTSLNKEETDIARILEAVFAGALANRASDIHLEPEEHVIKLRYRIDGLLRDIFQEFQKKNYLYLTTRIKLLSELKINVYNEPQDGRFTIAMPGKEIEIRTSVIPSEFGETIVLRILDPDTIKLKMSDLGLREDDLAIIKKELSRPNGMIVNTGPTGSGKTTTLYMFLQHVRNPEIKIITIEDPIEYHLEGVEQTQVKPDVGYTFASGLRSILRQDPDMILVGEIRDLETAEIAMHASLTGHLVFSTLHTNDAVGAVTRLIDMGIKPMVISPALNLIIAQRLVRRLCEKCRLPREIDINLKNNFDKLLARLPQRFNRGVLKEIKLFSAKGCEECQQTGYHGRIGIFELLQITESMKTLIAESVLETKVRALAIEQGMTTIQQDGIIKALLGATTLEEVEKITGPIEWSA